MVGMKIRIHPLFFIFGLYFVSIGKVFSFLTFTICALLHELGHSFAAQKLGYKLRKITLMPYGAVIKGDIYGISYSDEIKVVVAGPLLNLVIGLFTIALWWIFPSSYPYTELIAIGSFSLFFINLFPAFPLDGGRFLLCTLSLFFNRKKAVFITKTVSVLFSFFLLFLFVVSFFYTLNISLLFFASFCIFGIFTVDDENSYVRFYEGLSLELKKTKVIKKIAVNENFTLRDFYSLYDGSSLYEISVYSSNGKFIKNISPEDIKFILLTKSLSDFFL